MGQSPIRAEPFPIGAEHLRTWMVGAENAFRTEGCPLIQRLGLSVPPLPLIQVGEIVHRAERTELLRARHPLPGRQRPLTQRLGLPVPPLTRI